jgi:hypothetical protein
MQQELDPAIQAESLKQLRESLAKFKRSNQKKRDKLGGLGKGSCCACTKTQPLKVSLTDYKAQLEREISALEKGMQSPS